MSPPQLATDTPVLNVGEPIIVGVLIFSRVELDIVVHYRRQCKVCKVLHIQIPLHAKARFYSCICVAFAVSNLVVIILHLFKKTSCGQIFSNLLAHCHTILTNIHSSCFRDSAVCIENVDGFEVVLLTQGIVIDIVGRSHFQTARTEFNINISVFNNRDNSIYEWHANLLTFEPTVLGVFRVDAHSRVTHDCFRTSGCDNCISTLFV